MATPENLKNCSLTCYHCHNFSMGPCPFACCGQSVARTSTQAVAPDAALHSPQWPDIV